MTKANEYAKLKTPRSQSALNDLLSFNFTSCIIFTIGMLIVMIIFSSIDATLVGAMGVLTRWAAHWDFKRKLKRFEG
jgi:hypothetical protein